MNRQGVWATFNFEWKCSLVWSRLLWWLAIALFPVLIGVSGAVKVKEVGLLAFVLYMLSVQIIPVLGLMLWVPTSVHTELENKTWHFLALRPYGRTSLLLGKYLMGTTWTITTSWTGMTLCLLAVQPKDGFVLWLHMLWIIVLACMCYGAIFSFLGVVFIKKAMAACLVYAIMFEFFIVTWIPALINKFVISYHLRNLLFRSLVPKEAEKSLKFLLSDLSIWQHIFILFAYSAIFLILAVLWLRNKELVFAEED